MLKALTTCAPGALAAIAKAEQPFASRGDDRGTHRKELRLWTSAGIDVEAASVHRLTSALAAPWSGWLAGAVPSVELVEASRYFRQF